MSKCNNGREVVLPFFMLQSLIGSHQDGVMSKVSAETSYLAEQTECSYRSRGLIKPQFFSPRYAHCRQKSLPARRLMLPLSRRQGPVTRCAIRPSDTQGHGFTPALCKVGCWVQHALIPRAPDVTPFGKQRRHFPLVKSYTSSHESASWR